jgi:hypothetical protein
MAKKGRDFRDHPIKTIQNELEYFADSDFLGPCSEPNTDDDSLLRINNGTLETNLTPSLEVDSNAPTRIEGKYLPRRMMVEVRNGTSDMKVRLGSKGIIALGLCADPQQSGQASLALQRQGCPEKYPLGPRL